MKRIIIITIVYALYGINTGFAQTYQLVTNVKTPNNSTVPDTYTLTSADLSFTSAQLATMADDLYNNYGAVLIEPNSYKYNCHGYAWHVTEGGDEVWIGRYNVTSEDIYWTDGSYMEVSENIATKLSYHQDGNHSAIRLDSDWYQSKWGWAGPLVKHHPNDVPDMYQSRKTKKYYIRKPTISGPKDLCTAWTYTFSATNVPEGFTWDKSSNFTLTGTGNSVSVSATEGSSGWISIKLGTTELVRRYVSVSAGSPVFDYFEGPDEAEVSSLSYNWLAHFSNYSTISYSWSVAGAPQSWHVCNNYSSWSIDVCFLQPAYYLLQVVGENACGAGYGSKTVNVSGSYTYNTYYSISTYPNPASNMINIEIDETAIAQANVLEQTSTGAKSLKTEPAYDIRLYDYQGNLLRHAKIKGGRIEFNVANLPNGIYYLHIYDGIHDKPEMRQIVVEH
jgi:hypothetical protein